MSDTQRTIKRGTGTSGSANTRTDPGDLVVDREYEQIESMNITTTEK